MIFRLTWFIFECHTTFTGVESTASSFTVSSESLLMNKSLPCAPFELSPTPVTTYLSSGLNIAFVWGYNVFTSVFTITGFLNDRKSHTVATRGPHKQPECGNEMSKLSACLRTFYSVVSASCQDSSPIDREDHRTSLDTLSVRAFDRHTRPHKVRVGLPHMYGPIQTR
jgi:hypothetical protein